MNISIEDLDDNILEHLILDSNPFIEGQTLNLKVENNDSDFWTDKMPVNKTYQIIKVETFVRCTYDRHRKSSETVDVSVYVVSLPV